MVPHPSLKDIQNWFFKELQGPSSHGASAGALIRETPTFSREDRLHIYQYAYYARMVDCLMEDFPQTCLCLGEASFDSWARKFLEGSPVGSFLLADLGGGFVDFLASNDPGATALRKEKPFILDLALVEWSLIRAFYAPEPEEKGGWERLSQSHPEAVKILVDPSVEILSSPWDLVSLWSSPEDPPEMKPTSVAVYRDGWGDEGWVALAPFEVDLLKSFQEGASLGLALARAQEIQSDFSESQVSETFSRWRQEGLIVGVRSELPPEIMATLS